MRPVYFWTTSLLVAITFAALVGLLFPYRALQLEGTPERQQAWLLTVWTAGVMAVCFGVSGLLATVAPLGFRDVADAGSVRAAVEARREARERLSGSLFYNFAGWAIAAGGWLIVIYFGGWLIIGI